jgi:hypothetical protein
VTEALFIEGIDEPEESAKRCSSKAPMGPNETKLTGPPPPTIAK